MVLHTRVGVHEIHELVSSTSPIAQLPEPVEVLNRQTVLDFEHRQEAAHLLRHAIGIKPSS